MVLEKSMSQAVCADEERMDDSEEREADMLCVRSDESFVSREQR